MCIPTPHVAKRPRCPGYLRWGAASDHRLLVDALAYGQCRLGSTLMSGHLFRSDQCAQTVTRRYGQMMGDRRDLGSMKPKILQCMIIKRHQFVYGPSFSPPNRERMNSSSDEASSSIPAPLFLEAGTKGSTTHRSHSG